VSGAPQREAHNQAHCEEVAMIDAISALWKAFARPRHAAERHFVFIVTYARSGSTILQKIIANIPGCHFNGENCDALAGLYASFRSTCVARDDQGREPRKSTGDPWRGAHLINPHRYNQRLATVFVDEILQPSPSAWLIGFKEVRYFDYGDKLPGYLDYIRMTFTPALLIYEQTSSYADRYPDETIIVNYDDYCREPSSLGTLFYRLGVDFDLDMVKELMSERLNH
jgi:hypothetical protein